MTETEPQLIEREKAPEPEPVLNSNERQQSLTAKQESPLISILEKLATNPDMDVDKLQKVFNLHLTLLEREAEISFNKHMSFAQNEIQNVVVNRFNPHTDSAFADIAALHAGAKPIWTKYGFSVVSYAQPIEGDEENIQIICEVRHKDGHKIAFTDIWPVDTKSLTGKEVKTKMQGKGSTLSYARRYMELGIFDVAVSKYDKDGNKPELKEKEKSPELAEKLARLKASTGEKTETETKS